MGSPDLNRGLKAPKACVLPLHHSPSAPPDKDRSTSRTPADYGRASISFPTRGPDMKQFSCGAVVPGCTATFTGTSDDDILGQVATHAKEDHGMTEVPDAVVDQVRQNIQEVPA